MEALKIMDLENDGLNMAVSEGFLYVRCKRNIYKYCLNDMSVKASNRVFKKDGKARGFVIGNNQIYIRDFCDLYKLRKEDLQVIGITRLGTDLSSDICAIGCDTQKIYACIRGGQIAAVEIDTMNVGRFEISNSSFWAICVTDDRIYVGTVQGELIEINKADMSVSRTKVLGKKNIYSVVLDDNLIYTSSQDMSLQAIDILTFETVSIVKKAVSNMSTILGVYNGCLVTANPNKNEIALWDKNNLSLRRTFRFPAGGLSSKGVILNEGRLFGSDKEGIYSTII